MNVRIRMLRKALCLSQKEFAERIGLKQNSISSIEKKRARLTEQNVKNICAQLHVNESWLRAGEGEMLNVESKVQNEFMEVFGKLSPACQDYLVHMAQELLAAQAKI